MELCAYDTTSSNIKKMDKSNEVAKLVFEDSDSLLQRFYKHVEERPDVTYLTQPIEGVEEPTVYTFKEVYNEAMTMAAHLKSLNFPPQSKIAIVSKNCAHFFMAELAIWMSGCVTVALFPNLNASTAKYIFEHSEAKLMFLGKVEDSWNKMKEGVPDGIPTIGFPMAPESGDYEKWEDVQSKSKPLEEKPTRDADDESLIVYTSGSTGMPKGVLHTFKTISYTTKLMCNLNDFNEEDRYLSYLPIAHVMERWIGLSCSLYAGYQVFFAESLKTFLADLNRCKPTLFISVPRLWLKFQLGVYSKKSPKTINMLLKIPILRNIIGKKILKTLGLDCVKLAGTGSAPIPPELLLWYRSLGLSLLEGYGMSENFCFSHSSIKGMEKFGFVGNAMPGVDCKISDEGEILIKGPGNMVGYYKAPEKTAEVTTEDGYFRTGDKGEIDAEGRMKITGRIKELFKTSKGKYVAPSPIENILNNDTNIEMSLVGGSGQVMTMAVVQLAEGLLEKVQKDDDLKKKVTDDMTALLSKVNSEIEDHEKVGFIVVAKDPWTIDGGLLTPTMKIKRTQIEEQYEPKLDGWYAGGIKIIWE